MAIPSRRQRRPSIDIWPGFVDALSQLVMVIVFVLLVFTAGQFYLSDALTGRDAEVHDLRLKIQQLSDMLALDENANADLRKTVAQLSSQLQSVNAERDALTDRVAELSNRADDATAATRDSSADLQARLGAAQQQVAERDAKLATAQTTIDQLNQQLLALRQQLQQIAAALDASETKSRTSRCR